MSIQLNAPAPSFSLYDTDKNIVSLEDFRGSNVLLLFFPLAFTSVCTAELCGVRDNLKKYEQLNVIPIGISVDSLQTLNRYKQDQELNFKLLSDFNKEVSALYSSLYEQFSYGMRGVSKRTAFIIDQIGVVRYMEILENACEQPDFQSIMTKLAQLSSKN